MASGIGNKDDDYDSALQRLMRECLPPILVDIVDRRPPDPIEYMAHSLYKYREREDSASMSDPRKIQKSSEKTGQNNNIAKTNMREQDKIRHNLLLKGLIVEESDDFMNINEDLNTFNISNCMVHENCLPVLRNIGDIFDDDDIS